MASLNPGSRAPGAEQQMGIYRRDALFMMQSPEIPKILCLDEEDKKRYGGSPFGDACILARNILATDAGTRFIAINRGVSLTRRQS